ncbi:hypothetical protein L083_5886 [Actinoplanes sp. N902-109]|nr:hypothetical protein L083_5886 [Actinoplanes sp. N902-109]
MRRPASWQHRWARSARQHIRRMHRSTTGKSVPPGSTSAHTARASSHRRYACPPPGHSDAHEQLLRDPACHRLRLLEVAQRVTTGRVALPRRPGSAWPPATIPHGPGRRSTATPLNRRPAGATATPLNRRPVGGSAVEHRPPSPAHPHSV